MFKHMDIAESIYKGVVEPSHKKTTRSDANRAGHSRLSRGEAALSNPYSKISESAGKRRKRYVDYLKDKYKPTCLIHASGIHQMNERSWEKLVPSMIKVGLLRTAVTIPHQEINLIGINRIMLLLTV